MNTKTIVCRTGCYSDEACQLLHHLFNALRCAQKASWTFMLHRKPANLCYNVSRPVKNVFRYFDVDRDINGEVCIVRISESCYYKHLYFENAECAENKRKLAMMILTFISCYYDGEIPRFAGGQFKHSSLSEQMFFNVLVDCNNIQVNASAREFMCLYYFLSDSKRLNSKFGIDFVDKLVGIQRDPMIVQFIESYQKELHELDVQKECRINTLRRELEEARKHAYHCFLEAEQKVLDEIKILKEEKKRIFDSVLKNNDIAITSQYF